jgi:hypothetical protein
MRIERSLASARLAALEWAGHALGFMHGPKTRGRKSDQIAKAYPELQEAVKHMLFRKAADRG